MGDPGLESVLEAQDNVGPIVGVQPFREETAFRAWMKALVHTSLKILLN